MSRTFSPAAIRALMAEATNEVFVLLVTFWHGTEYFRCCLNNEPVLSRGQVFEPTYFGFKLPDVTDQAPSGCEITVDNVDQRMIDLLRRITTPLQVRIELVLASQPNIVEIVLEDLVLRQVQWNVSQITGQLKAEDMLNAVFPGHIFEPRTFAGVF